MINLKFGYHNLQPLLIFPLLILIACSPLTVYSLEDQIRDYFYKYQPTTGEQFAEWAGQNLTDYSTEQIYTALQNEGRFEAQSGHPNMVGVLSFAAREWAKQNNFQYNSDHWLALQIEAKHNLRKEPGKLQLWPKE